MAAASGSATATSFATVLPAAASSLVAAPPPADITGQSPVSATIGTLNTGKSITIAYNVTFDTPAAAGVNNLAAQATVTGSNFTTVQSNASSLTLDALPDLTITGITDGGTAAQTGGTVSYTIGYSNAGNQGATGVKLTESVPTNTTFNSALSSPGWTLVSGSTYTLTVGACRGRGDRVGRLCRHRQLHRAGRRQQPEQHR